MSDKLAVAESPHEMIKGTLSTCHERDTKVGTGRVDGLAELEAASTGLGKYGRQYESTQRPHEQLPLPNHRHLVVTMLRFVMEKWRNPTLGWEIQGDASPHASPV
jgi:hypothetical protein